MFNKKRYYAKNGTVLNPLPTEANRFKMGDPTEAIGIFIHDPTEAIGI